MESVFLANHLQTILAKIPCYGGIFARPKSLLMSLFSLLCPVKQENQKGRNTKSRPLVLLCRGTPLICTYGSDVFMRAISHQVDALPHR